MNTVMVPATHLRNGQLEIGAVRLSLPDWVHLFDYQLRLMVVATLTQAGGHFVVVKPFFCESLIQIDKAQTFFCYNVVSEALSAPSDVVCSQQPVLGVLFLTDAGLFRVISLSTNRITLSREAMNRSEGPPPKTATTTSQVAVVR